MTLMAPRPRPKPPAKAGRRAKPARAGLDPRVKFFRNMGLVRGHLLVGDELVKQGRWDDALPHFHHPIEELYASIRPTLQGQGIHQFDAALKALAQTVKAKKMDAYEAAWKTVDQEMTSATKADGQISQAARRHDHADGAGDAEIGRLRI